MSFVDRLTTSVIHLVAGGLLADGGAAIHAHVTAGPGAVIGPSMLGTCVGWVVFLSLVYGQTPRALAGGRPGVVLTVGAAGAAGAGVAAGTGAWWVSETSSLQLSMGIPAALLAAVVGIAVLVLAERWQQSGRHPARSDHRIERSPMRWRPRPQRPPPPPYAP